MKQLKLLLTIFSLIFGGGNFAYAQTDVTSDYITNADFSSATGWTVDKSTSTCEVGQGKIGTLSLQSKPSTTDDTHLSSEYCFGFSARWGSYASYKQTTASYLPKGSYTLTYDVENTNTTAATGRTWTNYFFVQCGEKYTDTADEWQGAGTSTWTTHTVNFITDGTATATFSFGYGMSGENKAAPSVYVSHLKLFYKNINGPLLAALIAQAQSLGVASDVISAAQIIYRDIDNTPAYQTTIDDEIIALKAKINEKIAALSLTHRADLTAIIPNAGFEGITAETGNYKTGNGIDYATDGWYLAATGGYGFGAVLAYDSNDKINDATVPDVDNEGSGGKALGISVGWNTSQIYQTAPVTLPAGKYILKVNGYNAGSATTFTSKFGFVPTSGSATMSSKTSYTLSTWVADELTINLAEATEGYFQIGGTAGNNTSGNHGKVFFDNITLTYVTAAGLAWEAAKAEAEAARDNSDYTNVTGKERTDLNTAINAEVTNTDDWYTSQTTTLSSATSTFTSAKTSYDRLAAAIEEATSIGTDADSYAATSETTAETALSKANTLYSLMLTSLTTDKAKGGKVLGFENGEYAPYNNVDILAALSGAEAFGDVAAVAAATTDALDAAITALNAASWSGANVEEVNAIAGGVGLTSYRHEGSYDIPLGWNNRGYNTRIVGITESLVKDNPGLAGVTNSRALLVKYYTTYGGTDGCAMPLKANTVYKFKFKYGLWDENIEIKKDLSVTCPDGSTKIYMTPSRVSKNEGDKAKCANKLETAWDEYEAWFKTTEAGDYKLNIENTDGSQQRQMAFADLELKKAVATDITIAENAEENPAISYSNVTLARSFKAGWNAVCLPFATAAFDGAEIAEFTNDTAEGDDVTLNFEKKTAFEANKPYLVYFPNDVAANKTFNGVLVNATTVQTEGEYFDFMGTYTVTGIDAGNWVISGGQLKKASAEISLKPTRTYFAPKSPGARIAKFVVDDEEVTGLKVLFAEQGAAVEGLYNLKGQKVERAQQKGIYVVNGKKVVK